MNAFPAVTNLPTLDFDIPAVVTISGFFYTVDFGYGVQPRIHSVRGHRCGCSLGADCPAVDIVIEYLGCGGPAAPEAPDGYYPVAPIVCPICGASVFPDVSLGSRHRGMGWRCQKGGAGHYWRSLAHLKEKACTCSVYSFPHRKGTGACEKVNNHQDWGGINALPKFCSLAHAFEEFKGVRQAARCLNLLTGGNLDIPILTNLDLETAV